MDIHSKAYGKAWEMIYKIIQTYINEGAKIGFGKDATYLRASKLDMKKKEYHIYCDRIAEFVIEKWFYVAMKGKSPFKMYNKYNSFQASQFLSFFERPSWKSAQTIAITAIMKSNEEALLLHKETVATNDDHPYHYEIVKQWYYSGYRYAKTIDGIKLKIKHKGDLPNEFNAIWNGKFFEVVNAY